MNLNRLNQTERKRYVTLKKQANMHFLQSKNSKYNAQMAAKYADEAENILQVCDAEADVIMDILKNGKQKPMIDWNDFVIFIGRSGSGKSFFTQYMLTMP